MATFLNGRGWYTGEDCSVVMVVVRKNQSSTWWMWSNSTARSGRSDLVDRLVGDDLLLVRGSWFGHPGPLLRMVVV